MTEASDYDYSQFVTKDHNQKGELASITRLIEEQFALEQKIIELEEKLEKVRASHRDIAEFRLPEIMDSLGIENFKTKSGIAITIKENIRTSLSEENKPKGFYWMEKNGFGGMIKRNIVVNFGRDEEDMAKQVLEELKEKGLPVKFEKSIHHSTLGAFVKEQLRDGKSIPLDIFGVLRQRISKVEK